MEHPSRIRKAPVCDAAPHIVLGCELAEEGFCVERALQHQLTAFKILCVYICFLVCPLRSPRADETQ